MTPDQINQILNMVEGFDWDEGNIEKSFSKHKITAQESEEVFVNEPLIINFDLKHSSKEERYQVLGQTNGQKKLFMVFTIRNKKIRIISTRNQNKRERKRYEKLKKNP
ncbi:MAG: BrnT family toxin [Patescibacteria group bacterium]|nr:BrnT family toxin [Patescibacteria group bacterium]